MSAPLPAGPAGPILPNPEALGLEAVLVNAVLWLKLAVEAAGALIIAVGVILALARLLRTLFATAGPSYLQVRLTLARHLALALEFQLGADILATAVSPTWDHIGHLGAIAVIRTGLNWFLLWEMREEQREIAAAAPAKPATERATSPAPEPGPGPKTHGPPPQPARPDP
ncbi:MAG: DUF1622 domain-containing protein [Chromatiaceae bacterium]|nr:MAG: DUF1622 domain-containing protein [Chromatiaceae bacterium]